MALATQLALSLEATSLVPLALIAANKAAGAIMTSPETCKPLDPILSRKKTSPVCLGDPESRRSWSRLSRP